jgi:hypothetical protein
MKTLSRAGWLVLTWGFAFGLCSNPEIADNELGITSRACADHYCTSKDSLDLWVSLEWHCHKSEVLIGDGQGPVSTSATDAIIQAPARRNLSRRLTGASDEERITIGDFFSKVTTLNVTRILTAVLSSILSVVGVLVGFRVGRLISGVKALEIKSACDVPPSSTFRSEGGGIFPRSEETMRTSGGLDSEVSHKLVTYDKTLCPDDVSSAIPVLFGKDCSENETDNLFPRSVARLKQLFDTRIAVPQESDISFYSGEKKTRR